MKKIKLLAVLMIVVVICGLGLSACKKSGYEITLTDKPTTVYVGDTIDFTQYFVVKDKLGNQIVVTQSMLDLSKVDTSKPGSFNVTLSIGGASKTVTITVQPKGSGNTGGGDDVGSTTSYVSTFLDKNLSVAAGCLEYTANATANGFEGSGTARGVQFLNKSSVVLTSKTTVSVVKNVQVTCSTNKSTGITVSVTVGGTKLSSSKDTVESGTSNANTTLVFTCNSPLSGKVAVTITGASSKSAWVKTIAINGSGASTGGGSTSGGSTSSKMEAQTYNPSTFDDDTLQDKLHDTEGMIGLPSTGSYHALVIPVQFVGDTITQTQLNRLESAFNGDNSNTGWESVSSYYNKSSYGKLNVTYDIQDVYQAKYNSNYYANYSYKYVQDGQQMTQTGEEVILLEALSYYEDILDLSQYDVNSDGVIDAVYLIYSAPVDYSNDSFYWAYVTWYYGENTYDDMDVYYYLFAGFDFMDESTLRQDSSLDDYYPVIPSLQVNAATFIHETGHLLGLDDYYDYYQGQGSDEGLGGADMMDYNEGDHGVYSKIMLGWITPTIVTTTTTLEIQSSQASAQAILIPLNFNNSYFCEYLLIDLYSKQGLNALHAQTDYTTLYGGASYGVRIYHVSSSVNDPFNNSFGSFTDNNNSLSSVALIKLVEADGESKFASSNGVAASTDLWQTGGQLSTVFPSYKRNDGKLLNFDISMDRVTATSATITITFLP